MNSTSLGLPKQPADESLHGPMPQEKLDQRVESERQRQERILAEIAKVRGNTANIRAQGEAIFGKIEQSSEFVDQKETDGAVEDAVVAPERWSVRNFLYGLLKGKQGASA